MTEFSNIRRKVKLIIYIPGARGMKMGDTKTGEAGRINLIRYRFMRCEGRER